MKVLILGSGGREHALAWAVKRSERVTEVVCAPGNGGIAQIARCLPVDVKDVAAISGANELTVRSRLRDAHKKLAEILRQDPLFDPEVPL